MEGYMPSTDCGVRILEIKAYTCLIVYFIVLFASKYITLLSQMVYENKAAQGI